MTETGTGERRLRTDAARSRAAVLTSAAELFASEGARIPLDRIAEHAGVGSATLFRHFPNRAHLLEAVVASVNDTLAADAERETAITTDPEALWRWLERMIRQCATERAIVEAVTGAANAAEGSWRGLLDAGLPLLERARSADLVDAAVSMPDILRLLNAVARVAGGDPDEAARLLRLVRGGIGGNKKVRRA